MAGRTISAHTDEATHEAISRISKAEDRPASQIVAAALRLYMRLPPGTRDSIRNIEAHGTPAEIAEAFRRVAFALAGASFAVSERRLAEQMHIEDEQKLTTEDDILAAAVRATRQNR
jgi:hypothetical protein